jgi:hypothetical protein
MKGKKDKEGGRKEGGSEEGKMEEGKNGERQGKREGPGCLV